MAVGDNEQARIEFVRSAINDHKESKEYRIASEARLYFNRENPTINHYQKLLYDMQGRAHVDIWAANHKLSSSFFRMAVTQKVSYLLANGATFSKEETKKALPVDFDQKLTKAARYAKIGGVSYGFWDLEDIHIFSILEFAPLLDEEDGALKAGIRFWQVAQDKPLRATLYEMDGFTEYFQPSGEDMVVMQPKRSYKLIERKAEVGETEIFDGGNYPGFPIIPLKNDEERLSELVGRKNTIDALDLAASNMVNNVDEGNLIYWVLSNCSGMDDLDDARFIERLKTTHVAHANGDDGARADAHTIEAPYEGTKATIEMLEEKLYSDFMCLNTKAIAAGSQTATAIKARYADLDLDTDYFEEQVIDFVTGLFKIAGIDDKPTFTRNRDINALENAQTISMLAPYFDDEYMMKKALDINGDGDQYEDMMKRKAAEEIDRSFAEPNAPGVSGDGEQ